uniref:Uncharacterized protein n=1 Tax=Anopheles minimus TaxID=112268 RepID=A0A182VSD7_9DIPT
MSKQWNTVVKSTIVMILMMRDVFFIDYLIESSDEEQEAEQNNTEFSVQDALRRWAISKNQTYESIEEVMEIIRRVSNCKLPKDARTLLKINRNPSAEILTVQGGQYWYHGIQKCISNELSHVNLATDATLLINVSIDGLPIFKSSNLQFWPILINIHEMPDIPVMVVAIYSGPSKPASIRHFLRPFVDELNFLMKNGVFVNNKQLDIKIRAIIADSPARAFIKGVISFNALNGCLKCTSEGKSIRGRVAYCECIASDRTDEGFRMRRKTTFHVRKGFCLRNDQCNAWFLTISGIVCQYANAVLRETSVDVFAKKLLRTRDDFKYPFNSKFLNVHRGSINELDERIIIVGAQDIK